MENTTPQPPTNQPPSAPTPSQGSDLGHPREFSHVSTPPPPPTVPKKSKKWIIFPLLVTFFAILCWIGFVLFIKAEETPPPVTEEIVEETTIPPTDTSAAQLGVLTWLEQMRTQGNFFNQMESCTTAENCVSTQPIQDIVSLWAMYKAGEMQSNQSLTSQVATQVATLAPTAQPWACRMLYDLSTTGTFNQEATQAMQAYCTAQASTPTQTVTEQDVLGTMQDIVANTSSPSAQVFQETQIPTLFATYTSDASDNAINGIWNETGEEAALASFNSALEVYQANPDLVSENVSLLGVAALDLYELTDNTSFLEFAEYLYNKYVPQTCTSLLECSNMLYFTQQLANTTQGEQYKQFKNVLAQSVLNSSFDGEGYANQLGKNAFFMVPTAEGTVYPTRENALILGTFSQK